MFRWMPGLFSKVNHGPVHSTRTHDPAPEAGRSRYRAVAIDYLRSHPRQDVSAPVRLGAKSVGWRAGDIDAFLADPAGYRAPEAAA